MKIVNTIKEKRPIIRKIDKKIYFNSIWAGMIFLFIWNNLVYMGGRLIADDFYHHNLELAVDRHTPFVPWTVFVYFICYLFWGINYILTGLQSDEEVWRFISAEFLAKTICLLFFILLPTTNVRPKVGNETIWHTLMIFLYHIDEPDNLFPSIHCLVSWFCFIGVRKNPFISKGYKWFSFVFAIMVCISTLTTKQHVIVDAISGILIAELTYFAAGKIRFTLFFKKIFTSVFERYE